MITMSNEQLMKIELLDRLFGSVDLATLTAFVESEQVVAKLKGVEQNPEIFMRLIRDQDVQSLDIMNLKNELASLKGDFSSLLKALNMTVFSYSQEMQNLKQKHNVY
jgi:Mg-chelatase subunit ChlI